MRAIAGDVGLQSGSLFYHFANKEEMLNEIVLPVVSRLRDETIRIAASPSAAETRFVRLVESTLRNVSLAPLVYVILDKERALLRQLDMFGGILKARTETYAAWERIVADGVSERAFRADIDVFLVVAMIVRALRNASEWLNASEEDARGGARAYGIEPLYHQYRDIFLRALRRSDRIDEATPDAA